MNQYTSASRLQAGKRCYNNSFHVKCFTYMVSPHPPVSHWSGALITPTFQTRIQKLRELQLLARGYPAMIQQSTGLNSGLCRAEPVFLTLYTFLTGFYDFRGVWRGHQPRKCLERSPRTLAVKSHPWKFLLLTEACKIQFSEYRLPRVWGWHRCEEVRRNLE